MALKKDVNSYVSVSEADSYFKDRLDSSGWDSADGDQKAAALVTATSILDDYEWPGVAISDSQPLAFPRTGFFFDPRLGREVDQDPVPDRIIKATFELANHLLTNENLQDDTGTGLEALKVGDIELKFTGSSADKSLLPDSVRRLLKPMTVNKGSHMWWRAN